jgi:hypothetical protein
MLLNVFDACWDVEVLKTPCADRGVRLAIGGVCEGLCRLPPRLKSWVSALDLYETLESLSDSVTDRTKDTVHQEFPDRVLDQLEDLGYV